MESYLCTVLFLLILCFSIWRYVDYLIYIEAITPFGAVMTYTEYKILKLLRKRKSKRKS